MASRRIKAALSPDDPLKRSQWHASLRERKPIRMNVRINDADLKVCIVLHDLFSVETEGRERY